MQVSLAFKYQGPQSFPEGDFTKAEIHFPKGEQQTISIAFNRSRMWSVVDSISQETKEMENIQVEGAYLADIEVHIVGEKTSQVADAYFRKAYTGTSQAESSEVQQFSNDSHWTLLLHHCNNRFIWGALPTSALNAAGERGFKMPECDCTLHV